MPNTKELFVENDGAYDKSDIPTEAYFDEASLDVMDMISPYKAAQRDELNQVDDILSCNQICFIFDL